MHNAQLRTKNKIQMRFLRTLCVLGMTAIHYGHLRRQDTLSYLHLSGAAALFLSTVNRHSEAA